jgi:hypothetical protein
MERPRITLADTTPNEMKRFEHVIVLPVSVFAFLVRRTIVQGLTMGALKK